MTNLPSKLNSPSDPALPEQCTAAASGRARTVPELICGIDWASTSLGPMKDWPVSLKSMTSMVLAAEQAMLLWWGPDLIQIYNDAFAPCLAGRHPAALGQNAVDFWQDVWPVVGGQLERVITEGKPTVQENALVPIWRNGRLEEVYWNYTYTPVFDDDGKLAGVLTICTETTLRVLAERREQMLNLFASAAGRCATRECVIDEARKAALTNPACIRSIQFSEQLPQAHGAEGVAALRVPVPGDATALTVVFGLSEQLPFDEPYQKFLERFTTAIGEAIAQAEQVRKYEIARADRDRLLLDAPVGTAVLVGEDLVYELANRVYCEIVGRDKIAGKRFEEVFPELTGGEVHEIFLTTYRTGVPYKSEEFLVRLQFKEHSELQDKFYRYNIAPLRSVAGGVYGLMVIAIDITPQVITRKEIERLNRDLIAAARAKDEFLAMLGHELRNPLAPISAAAELLQLAPLDNARVQSTSEIIVRQVQHMTHLINDLLDVSRVTRGLVELDTAPVDTREIVSDAIEQVTPLIRSHRHRLSLHLPPDVAMVAGDKMRLVQVVANLLNNAAKYTPDCGHIQLAIAVQPSEVVIEVQDDGNGIAPDLAPRVFDLFTQAERSSDRSSGGLGLGLPLVRTLVELHGGTVTCSSDGIGQGSRFSVRLPRLPEQAGSPAPAREQSRSQQAARALRILVVDDNVDAAFMLGMLLEAEGHHVIVEHAPHRALERAIAERPQVCLLDIGLPGMSGNELAQRLRAEAATAGSVLIAVTGYGQAEDRKHALAAGFDDHLVKPIDTRKLMDILAGLASKASE
jgi:signal transduction histidine kinase/ActR/RegA family two-component response regulator